MKSWHKLLIASLSVFALHNARAAAEESAPQEAPFVQEDAEFEDVPADADTAEALSIEDEVQNAESTEIKETKEAKEEVKPATVEQKETVNLNKDADPDKKLEEELSLEDEKTTEEEIVEEVPEAPQTPEKEEAPAVVEVKPSPVIQQDRVVQKSAKGGVEYIHHPQAAKGLLTITKEGAYIYRTQTEGKHNETGAFRMGMMDPPRITSADGTTNFDSMYSGSPQPLISFDYEWQPFVGYGKLGVQAGFGLLVAYGNGRFVSGDHAGEEAKESYTFLAIPLNLGVIYRLEWMHRQWFAPFVGGGGTYIGVAEIRDDGKTPKAVGTPGAYGTAGLLFNVSAWDRETAFILSSEYGIANLWVSLDYKYLKTFNEDLDFTSNIIGGGVVVDY